MFFTRVCLFQNTSKVDQGKGIVCLQGQSFKYDVKETTNIPHNFTDTYEFFLNYLTLKLFQKFGKILEFNDVSNTSDIYSLLDRSSCTLILTSYSYNAEDGKVVNTNNNQTIE